ncbi:hypothetical protein Drorol1_Dr00015449 [Drosera rotundifolia]
MTSASPAGEEFDLYLNVQSIFTMKARGSDTIKDIKIRFCDRGGVSEDLQDIFFAGACLQDHRTLTDYGVQKNSTLDLKTTLARKLFIEVPAKKYSTTVIVKASDTIEYIKLIIQTELGTPSSGFSLMHNGKLLGDNKTLASLNIASDSTLYVISKPRDVLSISVRTPDKVIATLEVRVLSSVSDLMVLVGSMTGTPIEDKILVYDEQVLGTSRTLFSYGIEDESVLDLESYIQIFVKPWVGKTITLEVNPSDTTEQLNERIFNKLGDTGCHQPLIFEGKRLDPGRTLKSYNVRQHSTIVMGCPKMHVIA